MNNESKRLQIEKATIADDEHNEIIKTMTPQEKAKELVEKFENGLTLKDCALIFINEMLMNPIHLLSHAELYYWKEVKKEIEKL